MEVNKVVYGGQTLMDITDATVESESLLLGATAYNAAGERITGTLVPLRYGTCATPSATQGKVVTCAGFTLTVGASVRVKFANAQSYNAAATAPVTLDVNGTGAKSVMRSGTTFLPRYFWQAGEVVDFVYDGTNYVMLEGGIATTTYYGLTKLSSSINSTSTSLAATPAAVKQAYDLAASAVSRRQTATLTAAGWSGALTQTVATGGVLADETAQVIQIIPALASAEAYRSAGVKCTAQGADSLTFSAETAPAADLTVYVVITEVEA